LDGNCPPLPTCGRQGGSTRRGRVDRVKNIIYPKIVHFHPRLSGFPLLRETKLITLFITI